MKNQAFHGKVALVTGGASGIGEACVHTFVDRGAKIVIVDVNSELGQKTVKSVKESGEDAIFLQVNVSDPEAVKQMVADTITAFGRLDIAVNNAGIGGEMSLTGTFSIAGWREIIETNLNSVFYCMRYEIPQMVKQGGGVIVNMSSIMGTVGYQTGAAYTASKHGIVGLTKAAALEYANQGLRINSVGPGYIRTSLLSSSIGEDKRKQAYINGLHPLGRMGETHEVANLVAFLCSDEASFLTGGYYLADGGYTAQ
jgi:NAD(P)-dependent dehydrogenase (short-subunit alcohol dehydrogenase family)